MPHLLVRDVRLDHGLVWAHAEGVRSNRARWVPLDDYAYEQLTRRLRALAARHPDGLPGDAPLLYEGRPDADTAYLTASASNAIIRVLKRAGVHGEEGVRPTSLVEHAAQRIHIETGSIEAVAARLGLYSLDATADAPGLKWLDRWLVTGPDGDAPDVIDGRDRAQGVPQ